MAKGALNDRLGGGMPVLLEQMLFKRARVHADANRDAPVLAGADDFGDLVLPADVAGIDPEAVNALLYRRKRQTVIKVDVGNERHSRAVSDRAERSRGVFVRHGEPHDL